MDERRLYAILGGGAALVVAIALLDVALGGGDGNEDSPSTSSRPAPTTTTTTAVLGSTTTTYPAKVLHDRIVQSDLRTTLAAMKIAYRDQTRYPEDPSTLSEIEPAFQYAPGIATGSSVVGLVYIDASPDGQIACASGRSDSGELFLIKEVTAGASPGTWFARGLVLPPSCDDQPLAANW